MPKPVGPHWPPDPGTAVRTAEAARPAVMEMWPGPNMAFSLCPMPGRMAPSKACSEGNWTNKKRFYPTRMVSGEWTGTMNLDRTGQPIRPAAVLTKAEPLGRRSYKIFGQKIFITYGDHDMTDKHRSFRPARLPDVRGDIAVRSAEIHGRTQTERFIWQ